MTNTNIQRVGTITDGSPLTYDTINEIINAVNGLITKTNQLDQKIIDEYRSAINTSYNQKVNELIGSIDDLLLIGESSNALRQLSLKNKVLNDITQNRNITNV